MKQLLTAFLLGSMACAQSTITHVIYVIKENHSTDELFGTFPGVQNYCQGGHSPKRCTNHQATSCTTVATHDVCGNGGWCEPLMCTTPNGPECSVADTCPQITTYQSGNGMHLALQDPSATYPDIGHARNNFVKQLDNGAMDGWPDTGGADPALTYFGASQLPYYYQLASTYGLEDNHFSTLGGPSAPNHLYMFSATSHELANNPTFTKDGTGSPGENSLYTHPWTCGALHTGTSAPYLYTGTFPSTQASDGTRYYGGTCSNNRTLACRCSCPAGTNCSNTFDPKNGGSACTDSASCAAAGNSCDTSFSIGGTAGAPCPTVTTIADVAEANGVPWGYYSQAPQWNAALYSEGIYFKPARLKSHIHPNTQFDTDVAACTGMCSNNHSNACTIDAQCGTGSCVDSDGSPAGSTACVLPKIVYLSPTAASSSDHPSLSTMSAGETWTKNRLTPYFANRYVYYHSIVLLTWDDWGGFYDHVPPPVQDNVPTLGFRVPLICIGPYCRNKVTHTQLEFASTLKCMEALFRLPAINSRDAGATDACAGTGTLSNNSDGMVDLSQSPIPAIGQTSDPAVTSLQSSLNPASYGQQVTLTAKVSSSSGTPTGMVSFFDSGSSIGSNNLSQGSTSISSSALQGGTHSITASYAGDLLFAPSTSSALTQTVNPSASATALQSSQYTSPYGSTVTFTATITGGGITPNGQATFYDGAISLGGSPISNGNATLTTSTLSLGTHSISAQYGGDSNYLSSSSSPLVEIIDRGGSSTTLTSSSNPSTYNQSIAFTANVTSAGGTPTGSVTFNDGTNTMAIVTLASGASTLHYSSLTATTHNVTASYGGDPNFQPSTSAPLTQTVAQATTTTALASSLNPSTANQSVIFTATATSQFGGPVTGSITFKQGTTTLSTVPLTNGQASYTTTFSAGSFSITAVYSGNSNNQTSTSASLSQTVNQAVTSTALGSSLNPSYVNQSITFTATVTSQYGQAVTGSVTFKNGATLIATVPLVNGQAGYTKIYVTSGTRSITATYSGDSNNFGSTSSALSQVVNLDPTTTGLTSSVNPSVSGQSVTFTANVTSTYGPIPDGDLVNVFDGTVKLASVPLAGGVATYTTSSLSVGNHAIKATYAGDATFATSTKSLTQKVN
jgi:phospholipase C